MAYPQGRDDFKIAIVCAMPFEKNAVAAVMTKKYKHPKDVNEISRSYGKEWTDMNVYTLGELGGQPIVLVCAEQGTRGAAEVSRMMASSFPNIKLAFLVGVTGGVPFKSDATTETGVRLGDVIVSKKVVEYDFGKQLEGLFITTTDPNSQFPQPEERVRRWLYSLDGNADSLRQIERTTNSDLKRYSDLGGEFLTNPGRSSDHVYDPGFRHKHRDNSCVICRATTETDGIVCEQALSADCSVLGCHKIPYNLGGDRESSQVFFGTYASGNAVMKSAQRRAQLVKQFDALAIEMEGAGVWRTFPTIVVKGVVDYADSHKNKRWREYPALRAALCTKAIIEDMDLEPFSLRGQMIRDHFTKIPDDIESRGAKDEALAERFVGLPTT